MVRLWRKANEIHTEQRLDCCRAWVNWRGQPGPQLWFVGGLRDGCEGVSVSSRLLQLA